MSIIDDIKNEAKKVGTNKKKFVYFKEDTKARLRFLNDMEEGIKVPFHDHFGKGINEPCQKVFGRHCEKCDDDELRTRDMYMWSVWNHDNKEVQIIIGAVNNASPIPGLAGMYEAYGTLKDRDYVITQNGKQTTKTFTVVPMDKSKFKNDKAKAFSKTKALELLDKAYPCEDSNSDDDDDDDAKSYSEMSAKELYELCKERDIECKPKKDKAVYIELLEQADADAADSDNDWPDDDNDTVNYEEMTAKELYQLCKERDIEVESKKTEAYYIKKLKAADEKSSSNKDDDEDW